MKKLIARIILWDEWNFIFFSIFCIGFIAGLIKIALSPLWWTIPIIFLIPILLTWCGRRWKAFYQWCKEQKAQD